MAKFSRREARKRRHKRARQRIIGTPERPRLNVYRSLKHIHAQIIDDSIGHTLVSASSVEPELRAKLGNTGNKAAAKEVGLPWPSGLKRQALKKLYLIVAATSITAELLL